MSEHTGTNAQANPASQDPKKIIVALDFPNQDAALDMADKLDNQLCRVKVGKELFTRCGPQLVKELHNRSFEVFLDLKFHDIPNTTANAVLAAADMGVWMVNVHAMGGRKMMEAAKSILAQNQLTQTKLIAVTVLTSMSKEDINEVGFSGEPEDIVSRLAQLAKDSELDGVVCSAQEARLIKHQCGPSFLTVTPGIRLPASRQDDQTRVMTPEKAVQNQADYLVIGRPITQAQDPSAVMKSIQQSLQNLKK